MASQMSADEQHFIDPAAPEQGDTYPRILTTCCGLDMPENGPVKDIIPLWTARTMLWPQIKQRMRTVTCLVCKEHPTYRVIAEKLEVVQEDSNG